jgi:hypothetical protein
MWFVRVAGPFAASAEIEDPDILIADVENYIGLMLDYFEMYESKSVLPSLLQI